eukprot:gene21321-23395_t
MELTRPDTYHIIDDKTRATLVAFYERGMTITLMSEKIEAAAAETALSIDKIKRWIGNQNAKVKKRKLAESSASEAMPKPSKRNGERKLSGQNVFYSRLAREGKLKGFKSNSERNSFVSNEWKVLKTSERESCHNEAKRLNEIDLSTNDMTDKEKGESARDDVLTITILEQLGVESANILIDENNDVSYYGPQRGIDCLNSNSNIDSQFRKYFEPTQKEFTYSYQDLQNLFSKEYAKAINSKVAKVAYLKGGFAIQGIPEDVEWKSKDGKIKRPCDYGQKDINKIMQVKENIKFIIMANPSEISLPGCILKLVDETIAKSALNGGQKIQENEVDVLTMLRKEEYEEIDARYSSFFSEEALELIRQNNNSGGMIVATFTNAPKTFWLFLYEDSNEDLGCLSEDQAIPGRWLQKISGQCFKHLDEVASIKKLNIIKNADGHVLSCSTPQKNSTSEVVIDKAFTKSVKNRLKELNLH